MRKSIRLYRFLSSASAIQTIEGKRFRVGRITEFNDPFEWKLGMINYIPEGEATIRAAQASILRKLNSEFGAICFSDTAEDAVLWSHYADHHRGVALVVDHWLDDSIRKVTCSDTRPVLDLNRINQSDTDSYALEILTRLITHKSTGWRYEREYRAFVRLSDCEVSNGGYFLPIPPDFLKRVILGFRCPLDEDYVRRSLDLSGFQGVEITRAKDDNHSFKIWV